MGEQLADSELTIDCWNAVKILFEARLQFPELRLRFFAIKNFYDLLYLQMFKSTIYEMLLYLNSH